MEQLVDFRKKKQSILDSYDKILTLDLLELDKSKRDEITNKKEQFSEEKFIVSFCGQINSGKSTLINSLIFGKEILPADDTPHTAKITFCYYSEKPCFETVFYSSDEWELIKASYREKNQFSELESDIERSINGGIFEDEVITTISKRDKKEKLAELVKYVAAPDKGGVFSPFVKYVKINYPSKILKDIIIVDTPGTNDPNIIRSKITEKWIEQSNAVVYVTYSGSAFDANDIKFIDKYLIGVPRNLKIYAINKTDTVNNIDEVKEWVDKIRSDRSLNEREIFNVDQPIVYCSALGGLLEKMTENGEMLSKESDFYKRRYEKNGYLKPEKHNVFQLKQVLEKKVISQKGFRILESNKKYLESIFIKEKRKHNEEILKLEDSLTNLQMNEEQLRTRKKEIDEKNVGSNSFYNEVKRDINKNKNEFFKIEKEKFRGLKDKIRTEISRELEKGTIDQKKLLNNFQWTVKGVFETNVGEFHDLIDATVDDYKTFIEKKVFEIKNEYENFDYIIRILDIRLDEIYEKINEIVVHDFDDEKLKSIRRDCTNWIQRILNLKKGYENFKERLKSELDKVLEAIIDKGISKKIRDNIFQSFDEFIQQVQKNINLIFEEMKTEINNLSQHIEDIKDETERIESDIKERKLKIKEIELMRREVLNG